MIALISSIYGQDSLPQIFELGGRTVVIWSLDQDKENSRMLERGFMYSRRSQLLEADTADYLAALRIANKRIENDSNQLSECEYQNTNQKAATATALAKADHFEAEAKKQKRLKIISKVVAGAILVLILL